MTVVVADTSPLNYLVLIGEVDILPSLYGSVLIPAEVLMELSDSGAPPEVARWIASQPAWLEVRGGAQESRDELSLLQLDAGERAAILLAQQVPDALLLIDDTDGRTEARRRGIPSTGTLGVLKAAANRRLLDLPTALRRLVETNFRVSKSLIDDLLAENARPERRTPE